MNETPHLILDGLLTAATICLAVFTYRLVRATQSLFIETRSAADKQLRVSTWLDFVKRFDSKQTDDARYLLATNLSQQLDAIDEQLLEFFEQLGIAWNQDCIDHKLAHSAFSYDAQHWWALVKPSVERMRSERGDNELYCDYEVFIGSMRKEFPNDPEITKEKADRYLKTELGASLLDSTG